MNVRPDTAGQFLSSSPNYSTFICQTAGNIILVYEIYSIIAITHFYICQNWIVCQTINIKHDDH